MAGTNYFSTKDGLVKVSLTNENDFAVLAECNGNPNIVATGPGFINGCIIRRTDVSSGNSLYKNDGDETSASWVAMSGGGGGGISGNIQSSQVAFGTAVDTIGGSSQLTWNDATKQFAIRSGSNRLFLVEPATGSYLFGDTDGIGNGTRLVMADGSSVAALIAGGDVIRLDIDGVNRTAKLGDTTLLSNKVRLLVDDTNNLIQSYVPQFEVIDPNSSARGLNVNIAGQTYSLGDETDTCLRVEQFSGAITNTSNIFWVGRNSAPGDLVVYASNTGHEITIGDVGQIVNGTRLRVQDGGLRTDIWSQDFYVRGYNDNVGIFSEVTNTYADVNIGDDSAAYGGDRLSVRSSDHRINAYTDGFFQVINVANTSTAFAVDPDNIILAGGDTLLTHNGFRFAIFDGLKTMDFASPDGVARFGDVDSSGNGTLFTLDDGNQQTTIKTQVAQIGNNGVGNNTYWQLSDVSTTSFLRADTQIQNVSDIFKVTKTNGDRALFLDVASFSGGIGDMSQVANLTRIVADDSVSTTYNYAKTATVNVDANTGVWRNVTRMGDKSLTDATPTGIFEIALPDGGMTGGHFTVTITATDGTELQSHSDYVAYSAVNKGGVYTTAITPSNSGNAIANSSGTLTVNWSIVTGTNKVTITVDANSSLTTPTIKCWFTVDNNNGRQITLL